MMKRKIGIKKEKKVLIVFIDFSNCNFRDLKFFIDEELFTQILFGFNFSKQKSVQC